MAPSFESKVIIITGASSGIGRATALHLASLGARLALSDIASEALAETVQKCPGEHLQSVFDVGSSEACNKFILDVVAHFGTIDNVFNCAGVNPTAYSLVDTTDEYWNKLVNTNLKGTYNIMRAAIPHMKSGSSFVNTSSTLGLHPGKEMAIYCATKFGIIGFSKSMAMELGPSGIRVNIIAPGYIHTPTNAIVIKGEESVNQSASMVSLGRFGEPVEVSKVVAFLFSEESSYMSGSVVEVHGALY